ncbi:hypothetical protein ACEYW6_23755 [Nostoc sp. UIC 10607]|uniref:hypothetical protein n=1 Tax=Nostoc sp. UIC 10607 TaxID=3045935 RepID=UPI0039A3C738
MADVAIAIDLCLTADDIMAIALSVFTKKGYSVYLVAFSRYFVFPQESNELMVIRTWGLSPKSCHIYS